MDRTSTAMDDEQRYAAASSRDRRFDGLFITAVKTTGIYCRPSCPAVTPKRKNVEFFRTAAAAQIGGYRACKRCLPDATAGSPEWNTRADVVGRAMRLIADGEVDRSGVTGLANRLGYSERQLQRLLVAETGAGALALARAQRAHTARVLIETTSMAITEVAYASGFASVRQFNDTIREVYATSPTDLRRQRRETGGVKARSADGTADGSTAGALAASPTSIRLAYRAPLTATSLFEFFGVRAVDGVESYDGTAYSRSLRLPRGMGVVTLTPGPEWISCSLVLEHPADTQAAVQRCRRMFDLDADPRAIDAVLGADPVLAPLIAARPGLRSPGHPDGTELLVRAILGQQVSVKGARTLAERLVVAAGRPLSRPVGAITHGFPDAAAVAAMSPDDFAMPRARGRTLISVCQRIADGSVSIDPGADREELAASLVAVPGIGAWTAAYVQMRALGDPDVFMPTDLGVRHGLVGLGLDGAPRAAAAQAEAWRPWRSYALHHLWATL